VKLDAYSRAVINGKLSDVYTPEAYKRLLLDSMIGDVTLYTRSDAVEARWKLVDLIPNA